MGMYTELLLKCRVVRDSFGVINYLFGEGEEPASLPGHKFFKCSRWHSIGKGCSFYHHPEAVKSFYKEYLFSRSDLKNYEDEIKHFLDWFNEYVEDTPGTCIGYYWYEEDATPTLVFKK